MMLQGPGALFCVGRLCEQKGQLLLVRARHCWAAEGRALSSFLVGDGEHRPMIEALIARLDLASHVRINRLGLHRSGQKRDTCRACSCPASFAEGLPVVLMEAMALGRPVLTTYVAGIPELVIDGETGWLFPAGSIDDMLAAMRACLDSSDEKLDRMGRAARIRAWNGTTLTGRWRGLSDLLASISGGPKKSGWLIRY